MTVRSGSTLPQVDQRGNGHGSSPIVDSAAANMASIGERVCGNVVLLSRWTSHEYFGAALSNRELIHSRENLLLDLSRDVMFDSHVQMTIVHSCPTCSWSGSKARGSLPQLERPQLHRPSAFQRSHD